MKYFLTLDLGGTKTSAALFTQEGVMVENYVYTVASKTFHGESAVYENSKKALEHILDQFKVDMSEVLGMGVGCPGPLDADRGIILNAPLMGWKNFPLKDRLTQDFQLPVRVDNDCNLGALAEQRQGCAMGLKNVIYVTVSTGVGAGILIDGQIYHGKTGGAGEFGHLSIEENGKLCPCGNRGCLELYCSGTAIKDILVQESRKGTKGLVFDLAAGNQGKLDAKLLAEAAEQGDAFSLALFERIGERLGYGLSNLFNLFDPDMVVIGGGVSKSHQFFEEALLRALKSRVIGYVQDGQIAYSSMCDKVVLYGACSLIREAVEKGEKSCHLLH